MQQRKHLTFGAKTGLSLAVSLIAMAFGTTAACAFSAGVAAETAWAADGYTVSIDASAAPDTIEEGSEFTVAEVLAANGSDQFTMYALATTVSFDASVLEVVSTNASDVGTATIQNGKVVYNALASVFAGQVLNSPLNLCDITFRAVASGDAAITVERAKVSTYSGMKSYPATATGATVHVGAADSSITPADPVVPEGSGTSDAEDAGKDIPSAFADNIRSNPRDAYGETLTSDDVKRMEDAGFTDEELVSLGFQQSELDAARNGESVTPALSANDNKDGVAVSPTTGTQQGSKETVSLKEDGTAGAAADAGFPVAAVVVIVVVVIAAVVAVVVIRRMKGSASANGKE